MLRCLRLVFPITDYQLPITSLHDNISIQANMTSIILCNPLRRLE
ncbi:hypothetical protein [Fischerella thermalis]